MPRDRPAEQPEELPEQAAAAAMDALEQFAKERNVVVREAIMLVRLADTEPDAAVSVADSEIELPDGVDVLSAILAFADNVARSVGIPLVIGNREDYKLLRRRRR